MSPQNAALLSAGLCCLTLLVVGCGNAAETGGGTETETASQSDMGARVERASGTVVMISAEQDVVMEASISGTVVLTDDGCVGLQNSHDQSKRASAAAWPPGTRVTADGQGLLIPAVGTLEIGDRIDGASGGIVTSDPDAQDDLLPVVPEECGGPRAPVVVVQWLPADGIVSD